LDESHHLLIKRSCKTDDENLDGLRARFTVCFLQPTVCFSWERSHCDRHYDCVFYIYALLVYTNTHSVEAK